MQGQREKPQPGAARGVSPVPVSRMGATPVSWTPPHSLLRSPRFWTLVQWIGSREEASVWAHDSNGKSWDLSRGCGAGGRLLRALASTNGQVGHARS